jgi:hypothetical protein
LLGFINTKKFKKQIVRILIAIDRRIVALLGYRNHYRPLPITARESVSMLEAVREIDRKNLANYTKKRRDPLLLGLYKWLRHTLAQVIRKILRTARSLR